MFLGKSVFQTTYTPLQFSMWPGDQLLVYSDGLTEQKNKDAEEFGFERLQEAFLHAQGQTAQEICDYIIKTFNEFRGDVGLGDDVTVIVLQKK